MVVLLFFAVNFTGCTPAGVQVVQVKGRMTHNGQPLDGASVTFSPTTHEGREASGLTNANGEFVVLTQGATKSGCMPGSYRVSVTKNIAVDRHGNPLVFVVSDDPHAPPPAGLESGERPTMKSVIPEKYGNAETSGLTAEVTKKGPNSFVFELTE